MDKKKVKYSIEQAMDDIIFIGIKHPRLEKQIEEIKKYLFEAKEELLKPDWISVEDELPSIYEDNIIVCNKDFPNDMRFAHRIPGKKNSFMDSSNFIRDEYSLPVTHWRKIDKLEV